MKYLDLYRKVIFPSHHQGVGMGVNFWKMFVILLGTECNVQICIEKLCVPTVSPDEVEIKGVMFQKKFWL